MIAKVTLDEHILQQLQLAGELHVEETHGVSIVLMTIDARQKLQNLVYDDSEWTAEEMRAGVAGWLDDPEGWGAPGMEAYDELNGDNKSNH
ncbi:MAG: hypothetical protein SH868_10445 [Bythopirellula sp.]|nr:hypothetical protein [Bythopirellula sp.]